MLIKFGEQTWRQKQLTENQFGHREEQEEAIGGTLGHGASFTPVLQATAKLAKLANVAKHEPPKVPSSGTGTNSKKQKALRERLSPPRLVSGYPTGRYPECSSLCLRHLELKYLRSFNPSSQNGDVSRARRYRVSLARVNAG